MAMGAPWSSRWPRGICSGCDQTTLVEARETRRRRRATDQREHDHSIVTDDSAKLARDTPEPSSASDCAAALLLAMPTLIASLAISIRGSSCQNGHVAANRVPRELVDEMFRVYSDRGSVREVATKCRVSHRTVERYRRIERWDERLAEIRAQVRRDADYGIAEAMLESLRIVRTYKEKLGEAIARKCLTTDDVSVGDLERLVRLEAFVLGAAESRHEVITEFSDWTEEEVERYATSGELPTPKSSSTAGT